MKRVIVHIDRLVLDGFPRADRRAIGAGLRRELSELLSDATVAARLGRIGHVANVRAEKIQLEPAAKPEVTGAHAARSIAKGLSR